MRLDQFNNSSYQRGASVLKESLWILLKITFFQSAFPWPTALKCIFLRIFGAKIGHGVVIRPRVNITMPWRLSLGDHVWIGEGATLLLLDKITIGSHVCISQESYLCTGSHDYRKESFDLVTQPILIEDQVWVAARVFISPGTVIRSQSMIQPCSLVRGELEGNSVYRGNPCSKV